jgi:hypothetical protein
MKKPRNRFRGFCVYVQLYFQDSNSDGVIWQVFEWNLVEWTSLGNQRGSVADFHGSL